MNRISVVIVVLLAAATVSLAQWDVVEDFNDGFPDGWTTAADGWTWIETGDEYPTPFLQSGTIFRELLTPGYDISGATQVVFQTGYYVHVVEGWGDINYAFSPDGPWTLIMRTTEDYTNTRGMATLVLSEDEILGDSLYFRYDTDLGGDGAPRFSIDNFRLSTQYPGWLILNATMQQPYVPESGGTVTYSVELTNTFDFPLENLRYQTYIQESRPWGERVGPLYQTTFSVPADTTITLTGLNQYVAPEHIYDLMLLYVYIGYPHDPSYQVMDWMVFYWNGE